MDQLLGGGFRADAVAVPGMVVLDKNDFPPAATPASDLLLDDIDMGASSDSFRLGSCELQEPMWAKMNTLSATKAKRKKSENKPQTQINKCNNEKKRREQENTYVEELAELISANFGDMSSLSVKPDKCAILQETVNQIRRIKQQEAANQQTADPVQQGEVSSSRPTILSNEVYGPLLLEALDGFLFVINSEGKVEHVTDNVSKYIKYSKDDIIGKSIYNFMHLGDHTKFHSNLLPMTIEWGSDQPSPTRSKSLDVRLLIKQEDYQNETVEEKNQRIPCYELMHIASTQLREHLSVSEEDGSDSGPCLLCVANRISQRDKAAIFFEQFTTRLDTSGKIICVSGVSDLVSQAVFKDCKGRFLRDLVPAQDVQKVTAHLKEVLSSGTSLSAFYRIQVTPEKLLTVQTKSKLFKANPNGSTDSEIRGDIIMSTHSIIGDNDTLDPGGGIGGPLMTSIVNGTGNASRNGPLTIDGAPPSSSASTATMIQSSSSGGPFTQEFLDNDFPPNDIQLHLDFPTTTWDLEPPTWSDAGRPSSRQSITPVSTPTPRPPSNPSYSNAPTVVQSPMPHYSAQQSPAANQAQQNQTTNPSFMTFGMMDDFPDQSAFSIEDQKDNVKGLEEPVTHPEPQRLRSLLTNPPTSTANSSSGNSTTPHQDDNRDRILKELLNQQDDDQTGRMDSRNSRMMLNRGPLAEPPKSTASSSSGNDMLRKLLNEKNDDDDIEAKAGMKKGSELLQQLLKKDSDEDDEKKNENNPHEDTLLRNLGFPTASSADRRGAKRSSDEKDDRDSKRSNNGSQVSSSGSSEKSEIYRRNQMLASLLENPTPPPSSIPPIPASVISATPQEKLPRVITDPAKLIGGTMSQNNNNNNVGRHNVNRMTNRQQISYLNNNNNNFQNRTMANMYNNQSTSTDSGGWNENNNIQGPMADPDLSEILDTVLDFVPDANVLPLESNEGHQTTSSQLSEMAAIKNIQNLLMQCEKAVPSPNVSLPARPPAYSTNVSTQNNMAYPPPNYPQNVKYTRLGVRGPLLPQYATAGSIGAQQLLAEQQRKLQRHAEEQKRRLLQQQKQQQLLIPSNATAAEMNSIQNIDSLLNNTVAPNVTLQRSNSLPQESQLSPNYAAGQLQGSNSLNQSNQRATLPQPTQTQPYSPHSQMPSPLGQQSFQTPTTAPGGYNQQQRLSPQAQFNAQLSPRQSYPQVSTSGGTGPGWQQQQQQRLTVQNPMLNAQLTRSSPAQQGAQQQRQSPFGSDQFTAPASPTPAFNQSQFLRLQRANSVPNATSQMPGGLGSPRSYAGPNQPPPHYSSNALQPIPQSPMLYPTQQDASYNCYEQQPQQAGLTGYERRGSAPSAQQHMQSGVAGGNPTSEFVRQELRAVVGARTAQSQPSVGQRSGPSPAQQLQQLSQQGTVDLDSLGITFEMPSGASESPKLWGAMGSDMGSMSPPQPATSRTSMEEGRAGDHTKTSLLQQLLSDQSK
ncbi:nuclear receptor coactivator 1-like isoform X2 [Euwallacea fornicatus]|uniref:nuclear receptor coactivator 1-like isoform X2 n=1 Tax=Euwallacea fornicatus TaxID=995702 RepID=UPI00338D5A04